MKKNKLIADYYIFITKFYLYIFNLKFKKLINLKNYNNKKIKKISFAYFFIILKKKIIKNMKISKSLA